MYLCACGAKKPIKSSNATITPVVTNWVTMAMNEEYFKIQTDLEKMRIYQKGLVDSLTKPSDSAHLKDRAGKFTMRIKEYVFGHVYSRYVVYINNMKRNNIGDIGILLAKVSESVKHYVYNNIVIKAYKSGMFDLNIEEVAVEIDPIREVELQFGEGHPLSEEYKRDVTRSKETKLKEMGLVHVGVNGEDDPESNLIKLKGKIMADKYLMSINKDVQHPFYKEYDARTTFRPDKINVEDDMSCSDGDDHHSAYALYKRGDIFEPTRLSIPREYWADTDPGLLNHMVSHGYINMYSKS